jgi:glycosyltransferase involved in cell wall biosynthesis
LAIFHLTSWLSSAGGGIPPVIRALGAEYRERHLDCVVAGLVDPSGAPPAFPVDWPVVSGRISGPTAFGYSPELRSQLAAQVARNSVVHVHGLWMYPGVVGRVLSETAGAVRVVSPHGMLEPWALQNSRWKKRLAGWAFEDRNLRTADCLHALCQPEADNMRGYGLRNPIAVIPNGVDTSAFQNLPGRGVLEARFPPLRGRRWILFLSRIHPKKGLPHLLRAWASVQHSQPSTVNSQHSDWMLVIAGPDELGHEAEMKHLATELGISWTGGRESLPSPPQSGRAQGEVSIPSSTPHFQPSKAASVLFTGPLHGAEKLAALGGAELFVLPSFSEGFSMAVLEAAAAGLPVLLTPQCNFLELAKAGGAVEVSPDAAGCEAGLRKVLGLPDAERGAMGQRGRNLVIGSYTWPRIASQMLEVYRWLLEGGSPPACVHLG